MTESQSPWPFLLQLLIHKSDPALSFVVGSPTAYLFPWLPLPNRIKSYDSRYSRAPGSPFLTCHGRESSLYPLWPYTVGKEMLILFELGGDISCHLCILLKHQILLSQLPNFNHTHKFSLEYVDKIHASHRLDRIRFTTLNNVAPPIPISVVQNTCCIWPWPPLDKRRYKRPSSCWQSYALWW